MPRPAPPSQTSIRARGSCLSTRDSAAVRPSQWGRPRQSPRLRVRRMRARLGAAPQRAARTHLRGSRAWS
eukprot:569203-Prymnesium_polylepis.2